jgi:hypothetical protein
MKGLKFSLLILCMGALSACALFTDRPGPNRFIGPREEVIYASFEEVWRATNLVLQAYPLRLSNMDEGMLETDDIKGVRAWEPPFPYRKPAGMTYRLSIRVVRGTMGSSPATKVIILKDARVQPDFFSDTKQMPSDGLEEKSLIYRIKREVQIERALNHAQKKNNG